MTAQPHSLIGLIGPPRSGTTLIANAVLSHSRVTGIIEPYQVRRDTGYAVTDLPQLLEDFGLAPCEVPHVAIKETTTRTDNVDLLFGLMENARTAGLYTGLVIILRCPFSAYLSQVEASRDMWRVKRMTEISEETFKRFAYGLRERLRLICLQARAQHFRIVTYEAFCRDPKPEIARLMALLPERTEPGQLKFAPPKGLAQGGDPKTRQKGGGIDVGSRDDQIGALRQRFAALPATRFFDQLRTLVEESACRKPDGDVLDELTRLVIQQQKV